MKTMILNLAHWSVGLIILGGLASNLAAASLDGVSKYNPSVIWGGVTNFVRGVPVMVGVKVSAKPAATSIRAGIQVRGDGIVLSGSPLRAKYPALIELENLGKSSLAGSHSNVVSFVNPDDIVNCYLPPSPAGDFQKVSMIDSMGVQLAKTAAGLALERPFDLKPKTIPWPTDIMSDPSIPASTPRWRQVSLFPNDHPGEGISEIGEAPPRAEMFQGSDLSQYFVITNAGVYKLTFELRIYVQETNRYLKPVTLPPVTVDVRIEK